LTIIILTVVLFGLLVTASILGIPILYPLLAGIFLFSVAAVRKGHRPLDVIRMLLSGARKTVPVVVVFVIIGMLIGLWMASGTLSWLVYFGLRIIAPNLFLFFCFLLTCFVSIPLGTSFGTVGTIGMVLLVIAKSGNVPIAPVAGAILSGAYFGDRNSPTSSSALLVSMMTRTDLYANLGRMLKTGTPAFIAASLIYLALSPLYPLSSVDNAFITSLPDYFSISAWNLSPLIVLIAFIVLRFKIRYAMLFSCISAFFVALFVQRFPLGTIVQGVFTGFRLPGEGPVPEVIRGGGISFMLNAMTIVIASASFSGLLAKSGLIRHYETAIAAMTRKTGTYLSSLITALFTASLGCTQTLAIIMNSHLLAKPYEENGKTREELALDIEDSVVVLAALIPWNVAGSIPLKMLDAPLHSLLFAYFMWSLPAIRLVRQALQARRKNRNK